MDEKRTKMRIKYGMIYKTSNFQAINDLVNLSNSLTQFQTLLINLFTFF